MTRASHVRSTPVFLAHLLVRRGLVMALLNWLVAWNRLSVDLNVHRTPPPSVLSRALSSSPGMGTNRPALPEVLGRPLPKVQQKTLSSTCKSPTARKTRDHHTAPVTSRARATHHTTKAQLCGSRISYASGSFFTLGWTIWSFRSVPLIPSVHAQAVKKNRFCLRRGLGCT